DFQSKAEKAAPERLEKLGERWCFSIKPAGRRQIAAHRLVAIRPRRDSATKTARCVSSCAYARVPPLARPLRRDRLARGSGGYVRQSPQGFALVHLFYPIDSDSEKQE